MAFTALRGRTLKSNAVVVIACAVLALSQTTNLHTFYRGNRTWFFALAVTLPPWLLTAAAAPLISALARNFSFAPRHAARSAVVHAAAGLAFSLAHVALVGMAYIVLTNDFVWARILRSLHVSFSYLFYQDALAYAAIVGICTALHYSNLRARLAEARLTALRAQLNPHFLFNTLNAVSSLSLMGRQEDVAEMIGRLGGLLRVTLDEQSQEVSLASEMSFIDDYLAIQRVRFADRLDVRKTIEPGALHAIVPSLLLQPIVENAVEHGIGREGPAVVVLSIKASRLLDTLQLEVEDTGRGFPDSERVERIGLANTRERLRELYGSDYRFEYGNSPSGGARVRIVIPFRVQESERAAEIAVSVVTATSH